MTRRGCARRSGRERRPQARARRARGTGARHALLLDPRRGRADLVPGADAMRARQGRRRRSDCPRSGAAHRAPAHASTSTSAAPRHEPHTVPVVFDDAHVVVIDKPAGVSSVPYEERETRHRDGPDPRRVAARWAAGDRATPLHVVHRIDEATSGLLAFAKTKRAELGLAGAAARARRGAHVPLRRARRGRRSAASSRRWSPIAATACAARRARRARASARSPTCACARRCAARRCARSGSRPARRTRSASTSPSRAPAGRRDGLHPRLRAARRRAIASPRLLLHAATLGFAHPVTGAQVELASPLPPSFTRALKALRKRPAAPRRPAPPAPAERTRAGTARGRPRPKR